MSVQDLQDKPWSDEELTRLEEGMPRLKESGEGSKELQGKDTSGLRWSHSKNAVGFDERQEGKWWNSWRRWSSAGDGRNKHAQRLLVLIPMNVTSEPIALLPAMIRWWESLRAREVAKVQGLVFVFDVFSILFLTSTAARFLETFRGNSQNLRNFPPLSLGVREEGRARTLLNLNVSSHGFVCVLALAQEFSCFIAVFPLAHPDESLAAVLRMDR